MVAIENEFKVQTPRPVVAHAVKLTSNDQEVCAQRAPCSSLVSVLDPKHSSPARTNRFNDDVSIPVIQSTPSLVCDHKTRLWLL